MWPLGIENGERWLFSFSLPRLSLRDIVDDAQGPYDTLSMFCGTVAIGMVPPFQFPFLSSTQTLLNRNDFVAALPLDGIIAHGACTFL